MKLNLEPGFDGDMELALGAIQRGWITIEQVEQAIESVDRSPGTRLLNHLQLTPDQLMDLESPAPVALPPEVAAVSQDPARRVDHYILVEHLGTGGMGVVHKAWDLKLSRWVALKFLKSTGDDAGRAYFEREARLAAGLSHPNIAAIYEVGRREQGPFMAMQYVPGQRLEQLPRKNLKKLVALIRDAARAVGFANLKGVIHRDLKPSNLMVTPEGHLYVMDFGVARPVEGPGHQTVSGSSGSVVGTPEYMAPEQARGEEVDGRSDVYSLGATLYEVLTGKAPFKGSNVYEVLRKVEEEEPRRVRKINPRIPPDLETIVLKCLEKDPARRYDSGDLLADDLERYLENRPIRARPPGLTRRIAMWSRRHRGMVAGIAVSAAALFSLAGVWVFHWKPQRDHLRLYHQGMAAWEDLLRLSFGEVEASRVKEKARETRGIFEAALAEVETPEAHIRRGRCLQLEGNDEKALAAFERAHDLDPTLPEARLELARALLMKRHAMRGVPWIMWNPELSDAEIPRLYGAGQRTPRVRGIAGFRGSDPDSEDTSRIRMKVERLLAGGPVPPGKKALLQGLLAMGRGDYDEAAKHLAEHAKVDGLDAEAMRLTGDCLYFARQYSRATVPFDRSLALIPNVQGYRGRGLAREASGNFDGAIADFTKAIDLSPGDVLAWTYRGGAKLRKGDIAEAIVDYDRAIELNPKSAYCRGNRGVAKEAKGDLDDAITDYTKAVELEPKNARAWANLGGAKLQKDDVDGAIIDITKAIGLDSKDRFAWTNLGIAKLQKGDLKGAIEECTKSIDLDSKDEVPWLHRGVAKQAKGDVEGAIEDFTRAIILDPGMALAWANRGRSKRSKGDFRGAIEDFTKAIGLNPRSASFLSIRSAAKADVGDLTGAIEDCTAAITLDPKYADAWVNRGISKSAKGDEEGAIEDFTQAITLDPGMALAWANRGSSKRSKSDFRGAFEDFSKAIELNPRSASFLSDRGAVRLDMGDPTGAMEDCNEAIILDPKYAGAWVNHGQARLAKGDVDGAIEDFTQAITLDPGMALAWSNRGSSKYSKGDFKGAIDDFTKAILINPRSAILRFNRGAARIGAGDLTGAIEDCTEAIALDSKHVRAWMNRGIAKHSKGDLQGAIGDYSKSIELDPKFALSWSNRGCAKHDEGDFDGAIEDCTQAIGLDPKYAGAWLNRGQSRLAKGAVDLAIEDFTQVIQLDPNSTLGHLNRGIARLAGSDFDGARSDFRRAFATAPGGNQENIALRLFTAAGQLLTAKKYQASIEGFRFLAERFAKSSWGINSAYNAACGCALLGEKSNALDWLEKAIEMGWKDLAHIEKDSDLDSLRGEERYKKLVEKLKGK